STAGTSTALQMSFYHPKISDFGLAKLGGGDLTQTADALGTPSYMAPEQTGGKNETVGPAADIYGLGAILYETLTGRPPFQAETPLATVLQVRFDDPVSARRLQPTVPRDLETICLKCLRKDPRHRYASAAALADDLGRFLAGETIQARPVSAFGRMTKWARRRPSVAALTALLIMTFLGGFGGVVWALLLAVKARDDAQAAQAKETAALDRHRIIRAHDEWLSDNAQAARELLRDATSRKETWEWRYVSPLCNLGEATFDDHRSAVTGLAVRSDGRRLVTAGRDGVVVVRDLADGKTERIQVTPDHPDDLSDLALNPADGRFA